MRVSGHGMKLAITAGLLAAGAALLWACGGGGSGLASRPAGLPAADSGTAAPVAETGFDPAGLEALPGWPQFPAADYAGPFSVAHRISAAELAVDGQDFAAQTGANNYLVTGTNAYVLCPGGDDPLAFAQYAVPDLAAERPVDWSCEITAAPIAPGGDEELPLSYFIGLANYTNGLWDWRGPFTEPQTLALNSQELRDRFVSAAGVLHFVVATVAAPQFAAPGNELGLTAVRIEQCLLGVEDGTSAQYFATRPSLPALALKSGSGLKGPAALDPETQYVTLSWQHIDDPLNNYANEADMYELRRLAAGESVSRLLGKPGAHSGENSFLDDGALPGIPPLVPGQSYQYLLRAENESGYTPFSSVEVTLPLLPPTDLQASDGTHNDRINLSWTRSEGAQGYEIYRDGQDAAHKIGATGDTAAWSDSGVTDYAPHTYYLRAVNMYSAAGSDFSLGDTGFIYSPPQVALSATPDSGSTPLTVEFDASASFDPDNPGAPAPGLGITRYHWDWESDGIYDHDSGAVPTATHEYSTAGAYTAQVLVTDDDVAPHTGSAQASVAVNLPGTTSVSGTVVRAGDSAGLEGVTVTLPGGGSGQTNSSGGFSIASVPSGDYDAVAALTGWTFLPDPRPVAVGAVPVSGADFTGYAPPAADLQQDRTSGTAPLTVNYDASASYDTDDGSAPGAGISKYEWDWDSDGSFDFDSGADPTVAHVYSAGVFTASVRVTDNDLPAGKQQTHTAAGSSVSVNAPPVADLQADPTSGPAPLQVNFDASGSTDSDGTIVDYEWDFDGDGSFNETGAEADSHGVTTAQFIYNTSGNFEAFVRVTDDSGAINFKGINIEVTLWDHTWGLSQSDGLYCITIDNSTNVYAVGSVDAGAKLLLMRYSSSGALIWHKTWASGNGNALTVDGSGNVYVVGQAANVNNGDMLLLKYDSTGNLIWQKVWGGNQLDYGTGICLDSDGNIYLIGNTYSFGGYIDCAILKLDSNANILWQKTWGDGAANYATNVVYAQSGDIFVSATSTAGAGSDDFALLKFSNSGSLLWQKIWGGEYSDMAYSVGVDSSGSVYVVGGTNSYASGSSGPTDVALLKYDSTGTLSWRKLWGGDNHDVPRALVVDALNNIHVTGYTASFGLQDNNDCFLLRFDQGGNLLDHRRWGSNGAEGGEGIAVTDNQSIAICGWAFSSGGIWQDIALSLQSISGTAGELSDSAETVAGTYGNVSGTEGNPTGTEDTGGGGDDALVVAGAG